MTISKRAFAKAFYDELNSISAKNQEKNKETDSKICGFTDFYEFKNSAIGDAIINRTNKRTLSLSELLEFDRGDFELEDEHVDTALSVESAFSLDTFLQEAGSSLKERPVLIAFFREVLIADRALFGASGLYADHHFQTLLLADSHYAELAGHVAELTDKLHTQGLSESEEDLLQRQIGDLRIQISEKLFLRSTTNHF